jgi:hypothetical protein
LCEICSIGCLSLYPIGSNSNDYNPKFLGASSSSRSKKPTLWIKRLKFRHSPYNTRLRSASGFGSDSSDYVRPNADGIVRIRGAPLMKIKQWQRQPELEKERAGKA